MPENFVADGNAQFSPTLVGGLIQLHTRKTLF